MVYTIRTSRSLVYLSDLGRGFLVAVGEGDNTGADADGKPLAVHHLNDIAVLEIRRKDGLPAVARGFDVHLDDVLQRQRFAQNLGEGVGRDLGEGGVSRGKHGETCVRACQVLVDARGDNSFDERGHQRVFLKQCNDGGATEAWPGGARAAGFGAWRARWESATASRARWASRGWGGLLQ